MQTLMKIFLGLFELNSVLAVVKVMFFINYISIFCMYANEKFNQVSTNM